MSADKRSVSTDALETLGTIITENEKRDAIHLAVLPVVAMHQMHPGAHVGVDNQGRASGYITKRVGIVDPFLKQDVREGERFWLVIYPRVITSLRHVWTHPDIADAEEQVAPVTRDKAASEQWMRDFLRSVDVDPDSQPYDYGDALDPKDTAYQIVVRSAAEGGGRLSFDFDIYGSIPPEFWHHIEVLTGRTIPKEGRAEYFSCAC